MNRSPAQLRIAVVLGGVAILATLALFPYLLALQPEALTRLPVAPAVVILAQTLQAGVACLLMAWTGLKLGASIGLGAPYLASRLYRDRATPPPSRWLTAAAIGFAAGLLILAAIALFGQPIGDAGPQNVAPAWTGLLASPYGAVVEETGLRAFGMGLIAWLLVRLRVPVPTAIVTAIVLAALLFGAGHLPFAAQLAPLTSGVVVRVVAYNALAGLAFGALYWKHGLEHAMVAHFCADLVLHVFAPAIA
jgi:hypothetical protein